MNPAALRSVIGRGLCAAILAIAAAMAGGCGPSTGGTGTGASVVGLQHFGATPQDLCGAAFSSAVGCSAGSPNVDRPAAYFVSADARVLATIDDNDIVIDAPCSQLAFEGTWATSPTLGARFYGALRVGTPANDWPPASAALQPGADPTSIELTLRDGSEQLLLGPATLARVAALPPQLACP